MRSGSVLICFTLLYWKTIAGGNPPKILFQSSERTVYFVQGQEVEIPCVGYGNPLPSYRWTLNSVDFLPSGTDDRIEMQAGVGTLLFHRPGDKDEGVYQCHASNGFGTAVSDLVFLKKAFIRQLPPQTVEMHQVYLDFPLTLRCLAPMSYPPAEVYWVIKAADGSTQPVQLNKRVTLDFQANLRFTNVILSDAQNGGTYYCSFDNPVTRETVQSSCHQITVHGTTTQLFPASIMWSTPSHMFAFEKENITLKCIFSGNPTPDVYWTSDNFSTPSSKTIQKSFGQELLIPDVDQSDAGTYQCVGINSETPAPVISTVELLIQAKPVWVHEPRDVVVLLDESVTINCTAYGVPTPKYKWYINGVEISDLNIGSFISNIELHASDPAVLTVRNVTLVDQMNIQCNATNLHGYVFDDIALNVRVTSQARPVSLSVSTSQCTDRLGMECVKVKAAGHCNDGKIAKFCQKTCYGCSAAPAVG